MSKKIPTTKTSSEILHLIAGSSTKMYVQPLCDPIDTHGLYGCYASDVPMLKEKIKAIGGKYIRVVKATFSECRIICFRLDATPEEIAKKAEVEAREKRQQEILEDLFHQISESVIINALGAVNTDGHKALARLYVNSRVDTTKPLESYVVLDEPTTKDEKRIYDIVSKANAGRHGCIGLVSNNIGKMLDLANAMNGKIKDEDKRLRRRDACLKYGFKFLADCFRPTA